MKTKLTLEHDLSWRLELQPETGTEETMLSAIRRGIDAKIEVYQLDEDNPPYIIILGEGVRKPDRMLHG